MAYQPKYDIEIYHDVAPYLAGISSKDFFLDADRLIDAWKITTEWTRDTFHGRLETRMPTAAPLSYGHLVCLGAPLHYSETAEPNITPAADSLEEAVRLLEDARGMDFTACPIFRQYVELSARVREVFPDSPKLGGLGAEGPLTSAALFRGDDFYMDVLDEPELACRYLQLMTDSVVSFRRQIRAFCGAPEISSGGAWLADDLASMLSPSLWDEMVIPYWKRYYDGLTSSPNRSLHCEALSPSQLPYLAKAGVVHYQPSVSPRLTLENLTAGTDLPFDWLLYAYRVVEMSDEEIEAWIRKSIAFQPTLLRTQFGAYAVSVNKIDRILAFMDIAERCGAVYR